MKTAQHRGLSPIIPYYSDEYLAKLVWGWKFHAFALPLPGTGPMKNYNKSLLLMAISLLVFEAIVYCFAMDRPYWGDEAHFVETINQFGQGISINILKNYNEMSTPLPFVLYSIWGNFFNFDIQTLRLLSVIIAIITYLLLHKLIFSIFNDSKIALFTTAFIVVHPYMIGLSVFVFTDMLAILFVLVSCISIREQRPVILTFSLACGLLCRQYLMFFTAAVGLYYLCALFKSRRRDTKGLTDPKRIKSMLLACLASLLPLLMLAILWKGLSPDNARKAIYMDNGYKFHLSFLILYIGQLFTYLFPVLLISWKEIYTKRKILIISLMVSLCYCWFPMRTSGHALDAGFNTVGLLHKSVKAILNNQFMEDIFFYGAFLAGLPILFFIIKDVFFKWREDNLNFTFFLDLSILSFLIVMPFSYLSWEKYFLPLLPLAATRLLLAKFPCKVPTSPSAD